MTHAMTWSEVVAQASSHSNDIKSAEKQLDSTRWSYYKSFGNFLPQVSANASIGQTINSSGTQNSDAYGINISQSLFKGLDNYYNLRSAGINYDLYQADLTNAKADYFNQVRLAFINLYIARQNVDVQKKILKKRDDNVRMIKLLYERGTSDKGSFLRTQAQYESANYNLSSGLRQLELARLKLSQLIENDIATAEGVLAVGDVLTFPDINGLAQKSPSHIMAKARLDLADIQAKSTISGFLPSVSLNASYQKSGSEWPPASTSKSISLNVSLPIFPGGENIADKVINDHLLDKAREEFKKSEKDIAYGVREAYENLKIAIGAYKVQKIALDASAERAKISQASYLNGLTSYNDWDLIQNDYISNQINLLNFEKNALNAEANWYKSYGGYVK